MVFVIGLDEVGRGALAGDVFTCGVLAPIDTFPVEGVTDSKALSAARREQLYEALTKCPEIRFHVARRSAAEIDSKGINPVIRECFIECAQTLLEHNWPVKTIQVDGSPVTNWPFRLHNTLFIPRGDATEWCIGAASILAKVERDRYMKEEGIKDPRYGWIHNVGYGTTAHEHGILSNGLSDLHRRSFCKKFLTSPADQGILDLFT